MATQGVVAHRQGVTTSANLFFFAFSNCNRRRVSSYVHLGFDCKGRRACAYLPFLSNMSSKKGDTCLDYLQEMAYHSTKVQFMGSQATVHSPVGNATSSPKMTSGRAILHISIVSLHPISDYFNHRLSLSLTPPHRPCTGTLL
jgi:hypothetical protein